MNSSPLDNVRILLVQPFLYVYSGSEVLTLELAEALLQRGARVTIASWVWSEEMADEVAAIGDVELLAINSEAFRSLADSGQIDLAWIHQGLIPEPFVSHPHPHTKFVFAHLSAFYPSEMPFVPAIETAFADWVFFVSPETRDFFEDHELLAGIPQSRKSLLYNPAPDSFHEIPGSARPLSSLLVVSNHLPIELIDAIHILRTEKNIEVTVVGLEQVGINSSPSRVDAHIVENHDAVITIGKTVQYGLAANRPAYCYDYFGGPGWITEENFDRALHYNFSGRGFSKKDAYDIVDEIIQGFSNARDFVSSSGECIRARFSYDSVLDTIEEVISLTAEERRSIPPAVAKGFLWAHETIRNFGMSQYRLSTELQARKERLGGSEDSAVAAQQRARDFQKRLKDTEQELTSSQERVVDLERIVAEAYDHLVAQRPLNRIRRLVKRVSGSALRFFDWR